MEGDYLFIGLSFGPQKDEEGADQSLIPLDEQKVERCLGLVFG